MYECLFISMYMSAFIHGCTYICMYMCACVSVYPGVYACNVTYLKYALRAFSCQAILCIYT